MRYYLFLLVHTSTTYIFYADIHILLSHHNLQLIKSLCQLWTHTNAFTHPNADTDDHDEISNDDGDVCWVVDGHLV